MKNSNNILLTWVPIWLMPILGALCILSVTMEPARSQTPSSQPAWVDADIGNVPAAGGMQTDGAGVYILSGAGTGMSGKADTFNFGYETLNGDGQLIAQIGGFQGSPARAGLVVRENLDAGARSAALWVNDNQTADFEWRATSEATVETLSGAVSFSGMSWVKIVRKGDWVGGYMSGDGVTWILVNWTTFSHLAPQIYMGMGVAGGSGVVSYTFNRVAAGVADASGVILATAGGGDGLGGEYYENRHLFGAPVNIRVDSQVDGNFQNPSSQGVVKTNEYGARWTGEIQAQFTEPYTFYVKTDDGVRLWVNEQLVIDRWGSHSNQDMSATLNLSAGQRYLLRLEYFQNHGRSKAWLGWSSYSTSKRLVPPSQLFSQPQMDPVGNGLPVLWEQHYFGQTGIDPNGDPDGDGLSNVQEYKRHSDPTSGLNWGVPNEWTHGDIDNRSPSDNSAGNATCSNGVFTVLSRGRQIWGRGDDFHFVYQPVGTNGEIVTRYLGLSSSNSPALAGLMMRETLDHEARNVMIGLEPDRGLIFQDRDEVGGDTTRDMFRTNESGVNWLKLVRNNDWIGGYISADGTNWTIFDWKVIKGLPSQVFLGMAVTARSHKGDRNGSAAQFDAVMVGPAPASDVLSPVIGAGDGLMASYRNDSLLYLPGLTNEVDGQIDFDWIHYPPVRVLKPDDYGVCWSGEVEAQFSEPYVFSLQCRQEDWVRVWVNEQLVINGWRVVHPDMVFEGTVNLTAGQHYLIRVEMYNNNGRGMARLKWESPSTPKQFVPQSQMYSHPVLDPDGSGLPVIWEQIYFGQAGVDPNGDPDGDGLSNLQEYQYHTNPKLADTDGDGIPDAWEVAHGLDPQYRDANLDYDNSGFSNLEDYQYGLDPMNPDVNGDGLPDRFEIQYLGAGPGLTVSNTVSVALVVNGAQATNYLGGWKVDGTDIYALDRRGGLDFMLPVGVADKYVLNLTGTQNTMNPAETQFKLFLTIDGQNLGQYILNGGYGTNGGVELVLPYLPAGPHTLHLFWDGVADFSSLRIKQVKLLAVSGADANHNGIKDWADRLMADESGLDSTNLVLSSYTSPVCLEGRDLYPSMAAMTGNGTNGVSVTGTTDGRWYANVPLRASTSTAFKASFQNGGVSQGCLLQWLPINVLAGATSLTIRAGDSLLLNALPAGGAAGVVQIIYGTNSFAGTTGSGVACKFSTPGQYTVTGTYQPGSGSAQSGNIAVTVVAQGLPNTKPAAWTWNQRNLNLPLLAGATLQADARLTCAISGTNGNGTTQLTFGTEVNEEATVLSRLGTNGPVLDSTRVTGFDVWSGDQAYTRVLQTYPDGSQLVEMLMISSPVEPDVTFVLQPIVSGVIFDDGTTTKTLTATNFDVLGQCPIRFVRPATAHTSVCNMIKAYQGKYQIGYRH